VSPEELDKVLEMVRAGGGSVLEVRPLRQTLEETLLTAIDSAGPGSARREASE